MDNTEISIIAPSPRDIALAPVTYQKLPISHTTFLAYVVAIKDPLNYHLDIYWPQDIADRYSTSLKYNYTFISEELGPEINNRPAYSCHLKGVEIISTNSNDINMQTSNMKEAYILMSKQIIRSGGWVLVSVSDIDVYRRILVNMFDIITRQSLNQELLAKLSSRTGEPIAKEYIRPIKPKNMFQPNDNIPKDYHIVYVSKPLQNNWKKGIEGKKENQTNMANGSTY